MKYKVFCNFCGEPFIAKRSDARFCGDTCRSKKAYWSKQIVYENGVDTTVEKPVNTIASEGLSVENTPVEKIETPNFRDSKMWKEIRRRHPEWGVDLVDAAYEVLITDGKDTLRDVTNLDYP